MKVDLFNSTLDTINRTFSEILNTQNKTTENFLELNHTVNETQINISLRSQFVDKHIQDLNASVHDDIKVAQNKIAENLIQIQEEQNKLPDTLNVINQRISNLSDETQANVTTLSALISQNNVTIG